MLDEVNRTLYIPLYGKSLVSKKGIILKDPRAEEIWEKECFPLKGKSRSKWLAYYMAMRARVFDDWLKRQIGESERPAVVLHIGCGMDSRAERVGTRGLQWYDGDFEDVIRCRKQYYSETDDYHMIACDLRSREWLQQIPAGADALIVLEGVSMYLTPEEITGCFTAFSEHFASVRLLMDCYTGLAARVSKYKNPINDVGVTQTYGIDDPDAIAKGTGIRFAAAHTMTPQPLIDELKGAERLFFKTMFAGSFSRKMYRIYEFIK